MPFNPLRPPAPSPADLAVRIYRLRVRLAERVADAAPSCEREIAVARERLALAERLVEEGNDVGAAARAVFAAELSLGAGGIRSAKLQRFWAEVDARRAGQRTQADARRQAWERLVQQVGFGAADRALDLAHEAGRQECAQNSAAADALVLFATVTDYVTLLAALAERGEPLPGAAEDLMGAMRRDHWANAAAAE